MHLARLIILLAALPALAVAQAVKPSLPRDGTGLSTAEKAALAANLNLVPGSRTVNGHALTGNISVTPTDLGLGNVENTADANKPISTATATALAGKLPLTGGTLTGALNAPSLKVTGASGAGFVELPLQDSMPATPVSGYKIFVDPSGSLALLNSGGYKSTLILPPSGGLTVSNSVVLATDGVVLRTLNIGAGGTLGSAAFAAIGTSGHALGYLDGANTWSAAQTFASPVLNGTITGTAVAAQSDAVLGTSNALIGTPLSAVISQDNWSVRRFKMPYLRDKLSKIQSGVGGIASITFFGDSYEPGVFPTSPAGTISERLYKAYGFRGVWAGRDAEQSVTHYSLAGGAVAASDFTAMPHGDVISLPAAGTFDCGADNYTTNRATVVYKIQSGGGTFKIQTRDSLAFGTAWTDVATVDTSVGTNGTLGTSVAALTLGKGFNLRVLGVSGTCIVSGALLENTTVTSGVIINYWARGGLDLTGQANTIPQANLTTLLGVTATDAVLISFQDYDATTCYPAAWTLWSTARATQSWVILAPHLDSGLSSNRTRNDDIAAWCKANGQDYADATSVVKDYATAVARGWMQDTAHLNSQGFQSVGVMFWQAMGILSETSIPASQNVATKTVTADTFTEGSNPAYKLRSTFSKVLGGGFLDPAGTQINVRNAASMTATGTGPFALAAWVTLPAINTTFHSIFHTSDNGGGYRPNNLSAAVRSDGSLRLEFYQGATSDGWNAYYTPAQWTPGKTVLIWLWRDTSGAMKFGFDDQAISPAAAFNVIGAGTISPTQSFSNNYVHFGGANNSPGAGSDLIVHECAYWNADVDPRTWFTTGRPPGTPSYWYRLRDGAGTYVRDSSGNNQAGTINVATAWVCPQSTGAKLMTSNTTSTITFNTSLNAEAIYNTSASTIASSTITLPSTSYPGQPLSYFTHGAHTAVTMAGGTVVGAALTSLAADQTVRWEGSATSGTWIRIQ